MGKWQASELPVGLGLEALRRLHLGEVETAAQWLDWARREVPLIGVDDPLVRRLQKGNSPGELGRRAGAVILEKGHGTYDRLLRLIPGAVSLDRVISFKAVTPDQMADTDIGKLSAAMNRRLTVPCLPAPGLRTAEFFDVDLSPLPSLKDAGPPNRFIAVNPDGVRVKPLLELFKTNPSLAQYRLAKELLKDSKLFDTPAEIILETLSRELLEKIK